MRGFIYIICLFMIGLWGGTACTSGQAESDSGREASSVVLNEAETAEDSASDGFNRLYPYRDIGEVGQTGRPQFLNVYANW